MGEAITNIYFFCFVFFYFQIQNGFRLLIETIAVHIHRVQCNHQIRIIGASTPQTFSISLGWEYSKSFLPATLKHRENYHQLWQRKPYSVPINQPLYPHPSLTATTFLCTQSQCWVSHVMEDVYFSFCAWFTSLKIMTTIRIIANGRILLCFMAKQ